jgi:ATP-dependent DNA helicase RecG
LPLCLLLIFYFFPTFVIQNIQFMRHLIDTILEDLEFCIQKNIYKPIETENIELKDASTQGDWKSIHETVCAFLNTEGGIIIFGIKEKQEKGSKKYLFTGYKENNEENYKKISQAFTDENNVKLDVTDYFTFKIIDFLDSKVCVLYIENLPIYSKFAYYEGKAYERILTGDSQIKEVKIIQHKEVKENLALSRELQIVEKASIEDLSVDALNEYIYQLNREIRLETPKADILAAKSFLERKKFLINEQVTTLGMLVCGKDIEYFLGVKSEIDCFVDSPFDVVADKKILKDNILALMSRGIAFVLKNIQVGVSATNGGQAVPEYSEKLIRESINNALAHRDYAAQKYTTIVVKPNTSIEIRNAGVFKKNLLIEYPKHEIPILRIIPDVKRANPLLADILKAYNRYEGRGIGISVMINECLANKIDLPYYKFHTDNEMTLVIRKGKLLDEKIETIIESYRGFILKLTNGIELSEEHKLVLAYFIKSEQENYNYRHTILLSPDNNHLQAIAQLKNWGLIYEHPLSEITKPIFIVNRQILQTDFIAELRAIFGGAYDSLPKDYKESLQIVYQYNHFSEDKIVSASQVSNFLFLKINGAIQNYQLKEFDNFKRKIRKIFENLLLKEFIVKANDSYIINRNFARTKSELFDE